MIAYVKTFNNCKTATLNEILSAKKLHRMNPIRKKTADDSLMT